MINKLWSEIWIRSLGNTDCSLENTAKIFLPKTFCQSPKNIIQNPGIVKSFAFFKKSVFSKDVALETKSYISKYMPKLFR